LYRRRLRSRELHSRRLLRDGLHEPIEALSINPTASVDPLGLNLTRSFLLTSSSPSPLTAQLPRTLHSRDFSPPARPSLSEISPDGSAPGTSYRRLNRQRPLDDDRGSPRFGADLLVGEHEYRDRLELLLAEHREEFCPRGLQPRRVGSVDDIDDSGRCEKERKGNQRSVSMQTSGEMVLLDERGRTPGEYEYQ
jgi:hypothetical protein